MSDPAYPPERRPSGPPTVSPHHGLTPHQQGVLERLLAGDTAAAAARATKVDRSTVHRWLKDSTFQAAWVKAARLERDKALIPMRKGRHVLVMLCWVLGGLLLALTLVLFAVDTYQAWVTEGFWGAVRSMTDENDPYTILVILLVGTPGVALISLGAWLRKGGTSMGVLRRIRSAGLHNPDRPHRSEVAVLLFGTFGGGA